MDVPKRSRNVFVRRIDEPLGSHKTVTSPLLLFLFALLRPMVSHFLSGYFFCFGFADFPCAQDGPPRVAASGQPHAQVYGGKYLRARVRAVWHRSSLVTSAQGGSCVWRRRWWVVPSSVLCRKLSLTSIRRLRTALSHFNRRVEKWASYFHPGVHTLGAASTQRVEGVNGVLKRVVQRNGSMVELDNAILGKVQDDATTTQR